MIWYWIVNVSMLGLAAGLIFAKMNPSALRVYFIPALIFRILAGIAVGLFYSRFYYSGDTFRFHHLSIELYHSGLKNLYGYLSYLIHGDSFHSITLNLGLTEEPRTLFFIKFLSILNFLSGGNYWINCLYLSFLSFTGSWLLIRKIVQINVNFILPAIISFAFFPSVIFWSSGVLKESLGMFCFGIITMIFLQYFYEKKTGILQVLILVIMLWIYWNVKYYIVAILIVTIVAILVADLINMRIMNIPSLLILFIAYFVLLFLASFIHPNFSFGDILQVLYNNHNKIISISNYKNIIPFLPAGTPLSDFIINIPIALFAGLYMPLPFQGSSLIILAPGLLNLFVLLASILLIYKGIDLPKGRSRLIVSGICLYILTLAILLSYSTPNFGTLERYKVSYLPLFLFLILAGNKFWKLRYTGFFHNES